MSGRLLSLITKHMDVISQDMRLSEIKTIELKSIPGFSEHGKKKTFMCSCKDVRSDIEQSSSVIVFSIEPAIDVDKKNEK